jgi:Domain of unknown function (DUF4913)
VAALTGPDERPPDHRDGHSAWEPDSAHGEDQSLVADLTATLRQMATESAANRRLIEDLTLAGQQPQTPTGLPSCPFPEFTAADLAAGYGPALDALDEWVRQVLVPTYVTGVEPSTSQPWCAHWWRHPQAKARLYAVWMAWQELTDPMVGGMTGPSVWQRDHLDPALDRLRSPVGPFAACLTHPDRPRHTDPDPAVPVAPVAEDAVEQTLDPGGRSMSARAMDRAIQAGRSRPLSPLSREFAHHRGHWWFADSQSWIRVDDPQAAAQLDALAADVDRAAAAADAAQPRTAVDGRSAIELTDPPATEPGHGR